MYSLSGGLINHDAPDDAPNPAAESEEELKDTEDEGHAVELLADAGRDHGADSRGERNAVQDKDDHSHGFVLNLHESVLTARWALSFAAAFSHFLFFIT